LEEARILKEDMVEQGCLSDVCIYTILMNGLCKVRNLAMVKEFFDEMMGKGLQPDCFAYNTRICAELTLGDASKAFQLREVMTSNDICSDIVTYNILIDRLLKTHNLKDMDKLLMNMTGDGLVPNCVTYTCLIHMQCERGYLSEAKNFFYNMASCCLRPSAVTYIVEEGIFIQHMAGFRKC
jgi:pentatricopeptide repeat protein